MRIVIAVAALALVACTPEQQKGPLDTAADAMGATKLTSIQYSGSGSLWGFGQAYIPGERWPHFEQRSYVMSVNYQTPGMRLNSVRAQGEHPPRGGAAQPVAADQRSIIAVSGKYAWTEGGAQAQPNPAAVTDRSLQMWATPHGVIKAAIANHAMVDGKNIAFAIEGHPVKATLNADNLVEKVSYLNTNEVVGDYPIELTYTDYADFGGVKFPRHIVETQDGFPTLDINVSDVKPNAPVSVDAPQNVVQAPPPPEKPPVTVQKIADGVLYLTSATYSSWAVEFKDFVTVVEGPLGEARSLAVNEEIAKAIPGKPIRYVVNTHAHYDHAGGLRTYAAQGATIVTQEINKPFYEKVWARPRTLAPDMLSKSPQPLKFETVSDRKIITDGARTLELYWMKDAAHHAGYIIAFLPKEGVLYYGDGYNPPAGDDPRDPGRTPEYGIDIYRNVTRLGLNVKTIAPTHSTRPVPFDNLKKAIGLLPVSAD